MDITGIILAGGKSRRMGVDKGFILWKNKPFISYIADAMKPLVGNIVIVSDNEQYNSFGFSRIKDVISDKGPLSGLYSGLLSSKTRWNLVLSCDVPLVNTTLLELLVKNCDTENDIVLFKVDDRQMPLVALYKKDCIKKCNSLFSTNQWSLRSLLSEFRVREIELKESQKHLVVNINYPEDLKILKDEYSN